MKRAGKYNITDLAKELGLTRQTIYYWIKKNWLTPKRDYRNYPIFTRDDMRRIKKWYNTAHSQTRQPVNPLPAWKWQDIQKLLLK